MRLALFDLDNTLLAGDSDAEWGRFLVRVGAVDAREYAVINEGFYQDYKDGCLDIRAFLRFALEPLKRHPMAQLLAWHAQYMDEVVRPMVAPGARSLLARHRAAGDLILIITATNRFVTEPIARELGVDHLLATNVDVDASGRPTGESSGTPCFQEGKITRLEAWLDERGYTLDSFDETWFYSDSLNDLPLLQRVSHPVAVDPDPVLLAEAEKNDWRVISLR